MEKGERIMRIHLTPKKGSRRLAGAAVAISALAVMLGLVPAASAHTVARAGPATAGSASAVAAPGSSACTWFPLPAALFVGDPAAFYPTLDGYYNLPGFKGVAYKITGQFPHSTTMSFTTYNDIWAIPGPNYVLNDLNIVPDPGSVNPFVPGTPVNAPHRNYTVWIWPDSFPVPAGLKNVVLYPTKAAEGVTGDKLVQWFLTMRMYHMQPGYTFRGAFPTVTAVSAANPSTSVRCPTTPVGTVARAAVAVVRKIKVTGPIGDPPEPTTGNKIYFTRYPTKMIIGPEGYSTDGCAAYAGATLPRDEISVITVHKLPQYFNNNLVTPTSIMQDYQTRYLSQVIAYWPEYPAISVNTDNAVYQPDGSWVTIYLPYAPRLTPSQLAAVRALAVAHGYNVIQLPPPPSRLRPLARLLPYPTLIYRNKAVSPSFSQSLLAVPCSTPPGSNYLDYPYQTSPAFFAQYASSPSNMGPYYLDGVKLDFAQLMAKY